MSAAKRDKRGARVDSDRVKETVASVTKWKSASPEAREVLVENLKEAIPLLQRYLVTSLMAAGAFAALAWAPVEVVQLGSQLPVPIPRVAALLVLGAVYFVTGLLASLTLARAKHLVVLLKQSTDPLLIEAVLMYPSIPTTKVPGPRVGLSVLPSVLVIAGIAKIFGKSLFAHVPIVGLLLLCILPLVIVFELRALVAELPDFFQD